MPPIDGAWILLLQISYYNHVHVFQNDDFFSKLVESWSLDRMINKIFLKYWGGQSYYTIGLTEAN